MSDKLYRAATLEAIARRTIKEYDASLITGEPRAIPIEEIAEQHCRLDVEYRCLRKNGIVLGCTVFNDTLLPVYNMELKHYELIAVKGGTIVIDAGLLDDRTDGRLRFTFAHEVAHWLIHKENFSGTGVAAASATKTSLEENSSAEREADILASALLMPAPQVKKAFYHNVNASRDKDQTAALAELFGVSKQAMGIFLKDHRLI